LPDAPRRYLAEMEWRRQPGAALFRRIVAAGAVIGDPLREIGQARRRTRIPGLPDTLESLRPIRPRRKQSPIGQTLTLRPAGRAGHLDRRRLRRRGRKGRLKRPPIRRIDPVAPARRGPDAIGRSKLVAVMK